MCQVMQQAGSHVLRQRIAEELGEVLQVESHRAIGAELGVAGTTIDRRGAELPTWPATDLLALAVSREHLRQAVLAYLVGDQPEADPMRAETSARQAAQGMCSEAARLLALLDDGRISPSEAGEAIAEVDLLLARLQRLRGDLAVRARA